MGRRVHTDTIIMVRATKCMIDRIYVVVNINKYWIKLSLTNDVVPVAIGFGVGGVVIGCVIVGSGGTLATTGGDTTMPLALWSLRPQPTTKTPTLARWWRSKAFVSAHSRTVPVNTPQPPHCCHRAAAVALCAAVALHATATVADASTATMLPPCCRQAAAKIALSRCRHRH